MNVSFPDRPGGRLLQKTATHAHYAPHPALAGLVAHYTFASPHPELWQPGRGHAASASSSAPGGQGMLRVVPDASGCVVGSFDGDRLTLALWGPNSRAVILPNDLTEGPFRFFIEFLPGAESRFFRVPLHEILDAVLPLETVDAPLARAVERFFFQHHGQAHAFFNALDRLLVHRAAGPEHRLLAEILDRVRRSGGAAGVESIAAATGYSPRHLNRVCRDGAGMGLKRLSRVFRVNAACMLMQRRPRLTDVAHALGYFDQAHFIHDFKDVVGVSPGGCLGPTSGFYNEAWKNWNYMEENNTR